MINKTIVLIFLGDFFFDARCINMADTIIDAGMDLSIIDAGKSNNQYRENKIHHISLPKSGLYKYIKFHQMFLWAIHLDISIIFFIFKFCTIKPNSIFF